MTRYMFIHKETESVAFVDRTTKGVSISRSSIADCASQTIVIGKVSIPGCPTATFRKLKDHFVYYSQFRNLPFKELIERGIPYAFQDWTVVYTKDDKDDYKKILAENKESIEKTLCDKVTSMVGKSIGYGLSFYAAWSGLGDRNTVTPAKYKRLFNQLKKEGYSIKHQETKFFNVNHKERKPGVDLGNHIIQTTVVYLGKNT